MRCKLANSGPGSEGEEEDACRAREGAEPLNHPTNKDSNESALYAFRPSQSLSLYSHFVLFGQDLTYCIYQNISLKNLGLA